MSSGRGGSEVRTLGSAILNAVRNISANLNENSVKHSKHIYYMLMIDNLKKSY